MPAPAEFIFPTVGAAQGHQGVMKATGGAVGSQAVNFKELRVFNAGDSDRLNLESYSKLTICEITNDKYTKVPLIVEGGEDRIDKNGKHVPMKCMLTRAQQIATAPIYERYKSQKGTTDTPIEMWDVIQDSEKLNLAMIGVLFVEQLASFSDVELYKLGVGGTNLRDLARRHVKGKERPHASEDFGKEMASLIEARQEESRKREALEARLLEMEVLLAEKAEKSNAKKWGAPKKKIQVQSAGIQPEVSAA